MNIWIDISHIPQYNFYKWLIIHSTEEGHNVFLSVLDRGKLSKIVQKELSGIKNLSIFVIGRHRSNKISSIIEANLIRNFKLMWWARNKSIDIGFSNGYQLALICALKHVPSYSFDDDPETIDYRPKLWFNTGINYCICSYPKRLNSKVNILPVLKEWSYLSPSYFHPDPNVLSEYGLTKKQYIFAREVSTGTVNYSGQTYGELSRIASMIPGNMTVVLSLERKETRNQYPKSWILLKEPVSDIHSLMYFSSAVISSGDSMAREGALLGVPSYYLGIREKMPAISAAIKLAGLCTKSIMDFQAWISNISVLAPEQLETSQKDKIQLLRTNMIDINKYMYDIIVHSR